MEEYEEVACFDPDHECICVHKDEQHDWEGCTVVGCECEAHWEE
jgi:hypothetical protein